MIESIKSRASLSHARVIIVEDQDTAQEVINTYAPEHLALQVASPGEWLAGIDAAGAIFLGHWTAEALGDYATGSNHVLPTYGYARNTSGLGMEAFYTAISVQEVSRDGLNSIGPDAMTFAAVEGLDAHRKAVSIRLDDDQIS